MLTIENYIGGEMVLPASGAYLDNIELRSPTYMI